MEIIKQNVFSLNYKHFIIDEIALEGLEGIGIDMLWKRVEKRISSPITEKMKARFWSFIVTCKDISFYQLPEPAVPIDILDRFTIVDEETGQLFDPPIYLDGPYEYHPVEKEYGSCAYYNTRALIDKEKVIIIPYEKVKTEYGDTLVMVASMDERWHALVPHLPIAHLSQMTPVHYCILELVGKSRENGQMTVGKTNITNIMKDSKLLFYNRNYLQKLDFIRTQSLTQIVGGKGVKSLLLRLKRFHQPVFLSMPKKGKIHHLIEYLSLKPDYSERTDVVIKSAIMDQQQCKKLRKTNNIFSFKEKLVSREDCLNKKSNSKKNAVKRRFICLTSPSDDESSQSDGETTEEPLRCQYKVGVNLLRQAYERFLDAGLKGLTQIEIAQLLGVEFYTARTICRVFKFKNIVREFLEDRGRQRTARFIAVPATGEMEIKFEKEKKKFLEYLDDSKNQDNCEKAATNQTSEESDSDIPAKKIKLDKHSANIDHGNIIVDSQTIKKGVTEVKVLDGLENLNKSSLLGSKKVPTLRQLRFANGILKVMREKLAISGYQTLSTFVSKETNEAPLDTKAMKVIVQKLVTDGQLKILKMTWPGLNHKYSVLLCAPHVKSTDSIVKSKYEEISLRAMKTKRMKIKKVLPDSNSRPLALYTYPRYMKIKKLHEFLTKIVYFSNERPELTNLPEGFSSLIHIIPELTVEFALGNLSHTGMAQISHLNISNDILNLKLRNAPAELFKMFLLSPSLQTSIRLNLKVLAMLGLIQLVKDPAQSDENTRLNFVLYVNRHAKIIDTTGIWPRDNLGNEIKKSYYFETFKDVENYWNDVRNISTKTTIELSTRDRKTLLPTVRSQKDVYSQDNGQILGDGLGPCGFDSCFFMEIPRLWSTYYNKLKKKDPTTPAVLKKPRLKIPKREPTKKTKVIKKKNKPVPKSPSEPKPYVKIPRKREQGNICLVKWSKEDDRIIMMCKAAVTIMSPVSQPGCLSLSNIVAKKLLSMNDPKKSATTCHKRAITLESNSILMHEKQCLINEMRHRRHLTHKYEGLLKKLRIKHSCNMSKLMQEAQLPVLELVWMMSQLAKSKSFKRRVPCIAMNVEDFHKNYSICPSSANKSYNLYRTPKECEPKTATIKEAIILTVMLSFKKELTPEMAQKVYSMFNSHSELILRTAVDELRKSGAVAAKDKILNNQIYRFNFQDIVQASYKVSASYQRKWISRLNSEFVEKLTENLECDVPQTGVKGCPDMNCLLCEFQTCDALELVTVTVPAITSISGSIIQDEQLTVVDIETKFKLKSGTCGIKNKLNLKNFSEILGDIEFQDSLEFLTRNSVFVPSDNQNMETDEEIISYLKGKKESGSTFRNLLDFTGFDTKTLIDKLTKLESQEILKQFGYFENVIVLTEFSDAWTMGVGGQRIIPAPWLTLDMTVRSDIFFKWAGVIMNKVFENPGCSVSYLSETCEFLTTRSAQDICMFLERCKCVKLNVMALPKPDLFSDDDFSPELQDFNKYESVENILIFPIKNSLTKFALLRKRMLEID